MNTMNWLLSSLCFLGLLSSLSAQKTDPCPELENDIRLPVVRENSTCGFKSGRIEICNGGVWKTICDSNWTRNDAAVACRQLGYSAIRADVSPVTLTTSNLAPTVPECEGTEMNISSCRSIDSTTVSGCNKKSGVTCFLNDSAPDICFSVPTTPPTNTGTDDTVQTNLNPTQDPTTSPITTETTAGTTTNASFLTSPLGIGVIVVIVVVIIFVVVLFIVIIVVVCKKSPSSKLEQSRVSPQNVYLEDLKMDSDKFNNSPNQRRRTSGEITISEHHLLEQSPLYEQVKDVAPPSISSHDSGRSTDASENNAPPTMYSTLERDPKLPPPTYATLEQADYAQVEPYFNGSLTRGAALTSPVNEDLYHTLDRTTSQSSYTRDQYRTSSMSSSPKARGSKPNSSPKQTPRTVLPSITDSEEIPTYAILEEAVDEAASMVSTSAVVSQRLSPHHSPSTIRQSPHQSPSIIRQSPRQSPSAIRLSPHHRPSPEHSHLQHTQSYAARPATHEHTMPTNKQKSNTLPHSGRSAPLSVPPSRHRHSGYIEEQHSNGVNTSMNGRLNAFTQDPVTSWV
ncbi:mucin-2-like [Halichondria panicea]|uniref:mucin-2-like n=1 Tax=Halichondria panicea TaxID=6063 RepID=UPI00312BCAC8